MKFLISLFLMGSLLSPILTNAGTAQIEGVNQSSITVKYQNGKKGGCYTMVKSKKSGKLYKKYVDAKYCKKGKK